MFGNARENIGFFHAGASVVDTGRVYDHDALPTNFSLNGPDFASARLKTLADLLLLRRNEVDELF